MSIIILFKPMWKSRLTLQYVTGYNVFMLVNTTVENFTVSVSASDITRETSIVRAYRREFNNSLTF